MLHSAASDPGLHCLFGGANLVVITADAVHGGRGGGTRVGGGEGSSRELFYDL